MTEKERINRFTELAWKVVPERVISDLTNRGFFTAPASTKYHGNYEGGLFDHSYEVAKVLIDLTEKLGLCWENPRSPMLIGLFHDLCKVDNYVFNGEYYEYSTDTLLKGHGDKSVMMLSEYFTLTEEEICCIRYHMGAFTDKSEWGDYTRAVHRYPNVLWTHTADMVASHVEGV
jgi:putative nucleotidyltransferase with HDIG domain